ncbi:methylenetetrahydrofolate reductase [Bacteroidia bacterium]|nr:methylenetetrahydrofolate reductase [Bacteroidia bacterium]
MQVTDIINEATGKGRTLFTFELLPPLKGDGLAGIFRAIDPLVEFSPSYINVTFHREDFAGSGEDRHMVRRRPGTVGVSAAIRQRYGVEVVPHLICGGLSRYDIEDALIDLDFLGINNVLALRGDNLRGQERFVPHPDGHAHAEGLVGQIADMNRGIFIDGQVSPCHNSEFCIGVAGYPEKHAEAASMEEDIANLKRKVDAGASYVVTQLSFDNGRILSFIEHCRAAGIDVPIIPGLKPLSTKTQIDVLPSLFHVDIPAELATEARRCKDNDHVKELGIEWAVAQALELKKAGVPVLHFYTMGRSDNMCRIARKVF